MQRAGAPNRPAGLPARHVSRLIEGPSAQRPQRPRAGDLPCAHPTRRPESAASPDGRADTPNVWQRCGAGVAAAVLTLQAALAPGAALAEASSQPIAPLIVTPEVLDSLLPLPTQFPPLPALKLPKMQHMTLKNGLRVILLEDRESPVVRGTLFMRGGQRASPPAQIGLASIAAAAQRAGGSTAHPGGALDDELEELAAAIEGGAGADAVTLGFSCLSEDAPAVVRLFTEVLTSPALPASRIDLLKTQAMNSVAHRNDSPQGIPVREAARLIYGAESIYAAEPTVEGLASITPEDAAAWLAAWERPDTSVLGVVGAFDPSKMARLIDETLGQWTPADPGPLPAIPAPLLPPSDAWAGKVFLIDRPGASQASVAMAEVGIKMLDDDEVPLDVLTGILNNFGGRLFDEIRSREGLAYSVSGGWASAPPDHPGLFVASAETAQPAALLKALKKALNEAATQAPTDAEVARAKEESLNSFVFSFSSTPAQLRRAVAFELLGVPQNYPFIYRDKLTGIKPADVLAAAQRHLHPEEMVTVVVGDARTAKPALEKALGVKVEELKLRG